MTLIIKCFKLYQSQLLEIDSLIKQKYYFSRSEITRLAIKHFLLTEWDNNRIEWDTKNRREEYRLKELRVGTSGHDAFYFTQTKTKTSVASKFSLKLLTYLDSYISESGRYKNRSELIRECLDMFFTDYKWLHNFPLTLNNSKKMKMKFRFNIESDNPKVVAFKVSPKMKQDIKWLITNDYHISVSDVVRSSIQDYIHYCWANKHTYNPFFSNAADKYPLDKVKPNIQISIKLPITFLIVMDTIHKQSHYPNRSVFIRDSLNNWMNNNVWNET